MKIHLLVLVFCLIPASCEAVQNARQRHALRANLRFTDAMIQHYSEKATPCAVGSCNTHADGACTCPRSASFACFCPDGQQLPP